MPDALTPFSSVDHSNSPTVVLFLDFDGVLHPGTGAPFTRAPELAKVLHPYLPRIEIVVSSSWAAYHSLDKIKSFLPGDVAARITDAVRHHPKREDPEYSSKRRKIQSLRSRYEDIVFYIECRKDIGDWLALDDDDVGWPASQRHHLVHATRDLGDPAIQSALQAALFSRLCAIA